MRTNKVCDRVKRIDRSARWIVGLLCLAVSGTSAAQAQATRNLGVSPATESDWAILVGAEQRAGQSELSYRTNDVELLAATLRHCGYSEQHILAMTGKATEPASQPLRASLMDQVPRFLRKLRSEDRLLVYFSGRAFRDRNGVLYLAPSDWDAGDPASAGLAVTWLRKQLVACPAQMKVLVIDVGEDDSVKHDNLVCVAGEEVAAAFDGMTGVVVFASCRKDEANLVWKSMGQSLFGFWFSQALAGHADRDHNGQVSVGELYDFVFAKVGTMAKDVFRQPQTPVRLIDPGPAAGSPVSRPPSVTLRDGLQELADGLAPLAEQNRVSRLGVAEFRPPEGDSQTVKFLGGEFGLLGRWCADELQRSLAQKAAAPGTRFEAIPHNVLHATLARRGFSPVSFRTAGTRAVTVHGKKLQAVVLGSFCARTGRVLTLRCDLQDLRKQRLLGRVQTTALLSESEWGMLGLNGAVKLEELPPPAAPSVDHPVTPGEPPGETSPDWDKIPPQGESYGVQILVDDQPRPIHFVGKEAYVSLSQGDVYAIRVENRTDRRVYLRLLVDGLNTLPERVQPAGGPAEQAGQDAVYLPAQRVSLDKARAWRLDARPNEAQAKAYRVQGFHRSLGKEQYEWETFKVVDAPASFAYQHQQKYTEQIGLITAAFYEVPAEKKPRSRSRSLGSLGTAGGERRQGKLDEYEEKPVGRLLTVINIHYVEPEVLEKVQNAEAPPMP